MKKFLIVFLVVITVCSIANITKAGQTRRLSNLKEKQLNVDNPPRNNADTITEIVNLNGEIAVKVTSNNGVKTICGLGFDAGDAINIRTKDMNNDGFVDVIISNSTKHIVHQVYLDDDIPDIIHIYPDGIVALTVIMDLAGDKDNFGFGSGAVPCAFFNNAGAEDLGVFDMELTSGDEVQTWHHQHGMFQSNLNALGTSKLTVTLQIRETFSDPGLDATLTAEDALTFYLESDGSDCWGGCECNWGTIHTFTKSFNSIPEPLLDHDIKFTFTENGDDIALDYSEVTVTLNN